MDKLTFVLYHYLLLGVACVAVYGLGVPLTSWISKNRELPRPLVAILTMTAGTGILIVALFVLGTLGFLKQSTIAVILILGLILTAIALRRGFSPIALLRTIAAKLSFNKATSWSWIAIAVVVSVYAILRPVHPPCGFDALMYQLPYARLWAEHGALVVDEWLRFPLFPYNMNLLYAASLAFGNDVLPQMMHGLSAALTIGLMFMVAQRYIDWRVGLIAAIQLGFATKWGWDTAYVDFGVMLFMSAGFVALALRHECGDQRFSCLAAFFAGIAVGMKYQTLFYLPVFVLLGLVVERRFSVVLRASLIFVVVGGYWYLRNYLICGDPIHPIGGRVFGFWIWNETDLANLFGRLERFRNLPEWYLCLSVGALVFWRRARLFERWLMIAAAACVCIWVLASGNARYLVAAYPMLALLSAYVFKQLGVIDWVASVYGRSHSVVQRLVPVGLLVVVIAGSCSTIVRYWDRIAPDEESRNAYLLRKYPGYSLLRSSEYPNNGVLYQLGFEDEIYYLDGSVRGEWFGPGRYDDVKRVADGAITESCGSKI